MLPRPALRIAVQYLSIIFLALSCGTFAQADTVDISFPAITSTTNYASALTADGYVFTSSTHSDYFYAFASWGSQASDYAGEPMVYLNAPPDMVTMTATDASLFDVVSMDFAKVFLHSSNSTVILTGTYANSTTTTFTFTMTTPSIYHEVLPSSFDNLKSLSWNQSLGYNQFGNIVVVAEAPSAPSIPVVPEPSCAVLLGSGLAALSVALRLRI